MSLGCCHCIQYAFEVPETPVVDIVYLQTITISSISPNKRPL